MRPHRSRPRGVLALATRLLFAASCVVSLAACGGPSEPSATGALATPIETALTTPGPSAPTPTAEPTAAPATTDPGATASPAGDLPTADAFWATVRRGLEDAGHLVVTADGPAPVAIRYLPNASEALVSGDLVSRCVETRSWAGDAGSLAPVPGAWRCGADALVDGFRATAAPIDSWSPDFPVDGGAQQAVRVEADGTWTWAYDAVDSLDGALTASVTLDPATGRLLAGSRTDASGTTTWTFDYRAAVAPIVAP